MPKSHTGHSGVICLRISEAFVLKSLTYSMVCRLEPLSPSCMDYRGNISLRFSRNSEASASEFLENLE